MRSTRGPIRGLEDGSFPDQGRGDGLDDGKASDFTRGKENIMKITDIKGLEVEQVATKQAEKVTPTQGQQPAEESGREDDVIQLSPQSRLMQKAGEVVYQTSEVRPEKVAALKDPVQQGSYEVDSQKVANSLITGMIQEK